MGCIWDWRRLLELEAAGRVGAPGCCLLDHMATSYTSFSFFTDVADPRNFCSNSRAVKKAARKAPRTSSKSSGRSLNKLIRLLLKIAGKKVWILLVVAVARTALSNRLARLQVSSTSPCWHAFQTDVMSTSTLNSLPAKCSFHSEQVIPTVVLARSHEGCSIS